MSLGVTEMTGVTDRRPREPNARVKGLNTLFIRERLFTKTGSHRSLPVTPEPACGLCQSDPEREPCGRCPLYGAWLERSGLIDDEGRREVYGGWVGAGGWTALWAAGKARKRAIRAAEIARVLALFPRVRERWPNYPSAAGERW